MGGAKRYPSIAFRRDDGFREELNPSYRLIARPAQVICPSGGLLKGVSSPFCKNISLHPSGKSSLQLRANPPHKRGVSWPSRNAGVGCGGRGSVERAMDRRAGSVGACERSQARRREMLRRTAKSGGPDAPRLAASLAELRRPNRA